MTQDFTDDVLAHVQQERDELQDQVSKLEADLTEVRSSHWELVQQLGRAHSTIETLADSNKDLEREVDWLRDRLSEKPYA